MMTQKTKVIGIIALIYVLIAGALLAWVLYEVETAAMGLSERVKIIADNNAKMKVYKDFSILVESTKDERAQLPTFVLTEDETSTFLTDIESIGAAQGVLMVTDSLTVVEKEGSFNVLSIQFSFEGTEEAVFNMVTIFETLPYHSFISSLTFEREDDGLVTAVVGLEVSLLKYAR